jgi:hypothetical protein
MPPPGAPPNLRQQWHQRVRRVRADLHRDIEKMVTEVR